ncbi:MAG: hypothetical protein AAFQ80_08535, partial [Cyanobacteria bacterium J06621_8]
MTSMIAWIVWKNKHKHSFIDFKYKQSDFDFTAFLETLKIVKYNQTDPVKVAGQTHEMGEKENEIIKL